MPETRIYVDLTTAFEERHRIPHGTTRVERKLIEALADLGRGDISFCRFDPRIHQFCALSPQEARATATSIPVADARREARVTTRSRPLFAPLYPFEVWFRKNIRSRFRRTRAHLRNAVAAPEFFEPGSVLLLPGELQRQDFSQLRSVRRRLDLQLAMVFYDLLDSLANDDPRVHDPDAVDIPGSEFIMREASLILPISRYSESALRQHAATRGTTLPPMHIVRLGHQIADVPPVESVGDLAPGKFALTVGDVTERKNHRLLADIWAALTRERTTPPIPLVVAGRIDIDGQSLVAACKADPATASTVRFLSDIDDARLHWLYRNCRFTLFPSRREGFGLPVVESLAYGKPCIASNATAIPEASQNTAIHLDPHDMPAWRHAIETFLDDDAAVTRATADIADRFRLVSWNDTASDALSAIAQLLRSRNAD